jgi:hypothetical protein
MDGSTSAAQQLIVENSEPGDTLIEIRIGSLDEAPFELKPVRVR